MNVKIYWGIIIRCVVVGVKSVAKGELGIVR